MKDVNLNEQKHDYIS